jgi:hypothetical protein
MERRVLARVEILDVKAIRPVHQVELGHHFGVREFQDFDQKALAEPEKVYHVDRDRFTRPAVAQSRRATEGGEIAVDHQLVKLRTEILVVHVDDARHLYASGPSNPLRLKRVVAIGSEAIDDVGRRIQVHALRVGGGPPFVEVTDSLLDQRAMRNRVVLGNGQNGSAFAMTM